MCGVGNKIKGGRTYESCHSNHRIVLVLVLYPAAILSGMDNY